MSSVTNEQVTELIFAAFANALALQQFDEEIPGRTICGGCFNVTDEWRSAGEHKVNCPVRMLIQASALLLR